MINAHGDVLLFTKMNPSLIWEIVQLASSEGMEAQSGTYCLRKVLSLICGPYLVSVDRHSKITNTTWCVLLLVISDETNT